MGSPFIVSVQPASIVAIRPYFNSTLLVTEKIAITASDAKLYTSLVSIGRTHEVVLVTPLEDGWRANPVSVSEPVSAMGLWERS
jgi:hypothetical protein